MVDKFLLQLETQLAEKKVEVTFTDGLRKHLAKKGFDPLMGARPRVGFSLAMCHGLGGIGRRG